MRCCLRSLTLYTAALLTALALSACGGKVLPQGVEDTALTSRVKTALLNHPEIGALGIDVTARMGVVTLSGSVPSAATRDHAVALARGARGVMEVKSALQVVPAAETAAEGAR